MSLVQKARRGAPRSTSVPFLGFRLPYSDLHPARSNRPVQGLDHRIKAKFSLLRWDVFDTVGSDKLSRIRMAGFPIGHDDTCLGPICQVAKIGSLTGIRV